GESQQLGSTPKTRTGTPMGTPYYMSPEQCRGKNVDHRTDIYSFGIMVHELLTGKLPFTGDDLMDLLIKQTSAAPPPMSTVAPELPAALDAPVLRMLSKDPAARPESVSAAAAAIALAAREAGFDVPLGGARGAADRRTPGNMGSMPAGAPDRVKSAPAVTPGMSSSPDSIARLASART